jgi:hypothetical protein
MFSASADRYILLHILACGFDHVPRLSEQLDDLFVYTLDERAEY